MSLNERVGKDVIAMLCLTALAVTSMATGSNHDLIMLVVGGLISLGGAVVGGEATMKSLKTKSE